MTRDDSRRPLKVQVKSGRGRTLSSKLWLDRQLNDPYVARAKREGYRSRAAYKLIEIDDKQNLLRLGASVVDLGAAPGGWSQVVAKRVGAAEGRGHVVAIDLLDMPAIPGVQFVRLDFLDAAAPDAIKGLLGGPADVVLSDMAANATGHRATDHIKIMALAEAAAEMAHDVLKPGGAFLCKVLQGGTESTLLAQLKKDFAAVKHVKPAASRADSAELYLLARGFRARCPPQLSARKAQSGFLSDGAVVGVVGSGARWASAAPASEGIRQNTKQLTAEIAATISQAGWKSAAVIVS
jgi:23S rRNA (uridine2552-2'-O)-methyltransferase